MNIALIFIWFNIWKNKNKNLEFLDRELEAYLSWTWIEATDILRLKMYENGVHWLDKDPKTMAAHVAFSRRVAWFEFFIVL